MSKSGTKTVDQPKVKYITSLSDVAKVRYLEKLTDVKNIDPFEHEVWSDDHCLLPPVEKDDISEYLVHRTSYYTPEKFKAEKSLLAHNQLTSGWLKKIVSHKPQGCDNTIMTSEVHHSQNLSEKPLRPWSIVCPDGTVQSAHCDCMAGIGEACTHVAALLFGVDVAVRLQSSKTPTMFPAYWVNPSCRDAMYEESANIDFSSSSTKRRRLEDAINDTQTPGKGKRKARAVPAPSNGELQTFFDTIHLSRTGTKPAVLSLFADYACDYKATESSLPDVLEDLHDSTMVVKPYSEVLQHCKTITISVTKEQADLAEEHTRDQANSKTWMRLRAGRVTASRAHQICHTNPAQPSLSLIRDVCCPASKKQTAAMQWGVTKEKTAVSEYLKLAVKNHTGLTMTQCGLFISPTHPHIGASPDGILDCLCHGRGCLEVKCPASKAHLTIDESCQDSSFCLAKDELGRTYLRQKHAYYTQVQVQMFVSDTDYCDFVVWTPKDIFVQRIEKDITFVEGLLPAMEHFFSVAVLPELVGHCFSRPQPLSESRAEGQNTSSVHDKSAELFCTCRRPEDEDNMVACDNENCAIEWFHYFCVGVASRPKGCWYCPDCRKLPEFKRRGKAAAKK